MSVLAEKGLHGLPDAAQARDAEVLVLCHHGIRSAQVAGWLSAKGWTRTFSVSGGIDEYARRVDPYGRQLLETKPGGHGRPDAVRCRWLLLEGELAVLVEQLTVHQDLRILAQITDHVPVDGRFVLGAGFRIASAHCHVE